MNELSLKLKEINIPMAYGKFPTPQNIPYVIYFGNGQNKNLADDTIYNKENKYLLEYYFEFKSSATEEKIENILLELGYIYEKSEDIYIESQDMYLIKYYI